MNKIFSIAWKDTLVRFSERSEIIFFLILPIVFTVLLGSIGGSGSQNISLLVANEDNSSLAMELIGELQKSTTLKVKLLSLDEAKKQFNDKKAPAWLVVPQGFEASLLAGNQGKLELHKAPKNNDADVAERVILSSISTVNRALAVARNSLVEAEAIQMFASSSEKQSYFTASIMAAQQAFKEAPQRIEVTRPAESGTASTYNQHTQASTGQLVTWVFIPLLSISSLFALERQQRTLQRLITTPTQKVTFLMGIITGQLATAIMQMLLLIGFGVLVMKISWGHSSTGLAVMLLSFGLASVAMGTMLGTFVKTVKQAGNLSIMLGMVMALLGGCWWPGELFPAVVRTATKVLPTAWAMQGFNDLAMRGLGLVDILPSAFVLLGFAVVFFGIGVWRFRYE